VVGKSKQDGEALVHIEWWGTQPARREELRRERYDPPVVARLGDALRRLALHDPSDHRAVSRTQAIRDRTSTRLFRPRSVALIGVSANAHQLNGMPLRLLRKHGFAGEIFLVKPEV